MRVLIVEDDPEIARLVCEAITRSGDAASIVSDGEKGLETAIMNSFGVIVLDVMLPKLDGWTVCRRLREAAVDTPILMLTARDSVEDRVRGLDCGADDYLVKPFDLKELLARIRALHRRQAQLRSGIINVGSLKIDTLSQTVTRADETVHLTPREFELLSALARHPGQVFTRERILERVWNNDEALPTTVNFHMSSLRRKVDPDSKLIHTVHGFGYVLRSGSQEA